MSAMVWVIERIGRTTLDLSGRLVAPVVEVFLVCAPNGRASSLVAIVGEMIRLLALMLPHLVPSSASAINRHTSNCAFGTFMVYTLEDTH